MKLISVIVPCYNEEKVIKMFYTELTAVTDKMTDCGFEFIFIDDGSKDETLNILKELRSTDKKVKFISFSRNFGKEAGLYAGLLNSKGDYVVVMDADLQDPPTLLPEMYETVSAGEFDCVCTFRSTRDGEPPIRSFFARMFYRLINKISAVKIVDGARDYRFMTRQMVDSILEITEYNRFSKGIFAWVGFNTKYIEYKNIERAAGTTKWSFWKLLYYSLEGIMAFSTAPLTLSVFIGILFCVAAFIMTCVTVTKTLLFGDPVAGYPTLISVILMLSGIQLFTIGVIGQYLAKSYMEIKKRPIFVAKESALTTE